MQKKSNYLLINIIYFIIYFSNAFFFSFFQLYLVSKSFLESHIGVISSLTPLLALIVNPIYNLFGNTNKRIKTLFMFLSIMEGIAILAVYGVSTFSLLILVMIFVSIIDQPLFVVMESYASKYCLENNKVYSYTRTIGSISYALATFLGGFIIQFSNSYLLVFIIAAVLMFISSVMIKFLKLNEGEIEKSDNSFAQLFKNKSFVFFLIFFSLVVAFGLLGDTYVSVFLTERKGLNTAQFGIISASWVFIEVAVILLLNKFNVKRDNLLMFMMGFCYFFRFLAIGLNMPTVVVIIASLSRGISMGVFVYLYIKKLSSIVSNSQLSSSLLLISIFKCTLQSILLFSSGYLIEAFDYGKIFIIYAIVLFIFLIAFFALEKLMVKKVNE